MDDGSWAQLPVCDEMTAVTDDRVACRASGADFSGLKQDDGNWTSFEDVQAVFAGSTAKQGNLSIGFGFQDDWVGPECEAAR